MSQPAYLGRTNTSLPSLSNFFTMMKAGVVFTSLTVHSPQHRILHESFRSGLTQTLPNARSWKNDLPSRREQLARQEGPSPTHARHWERRINRHFRRLSGTERKEDRHAAAA